MQYRYWIFLNIADIISSKAKAKAKAKAKVKAEAKGKRQKSKRKRQKTKQKQTQKAITRDKVNNSQRGFVKGEKNKI